MVGQSVLLECLADPAVTRILVITRRSLARKDGKLTELLHQDFTDFAPLRQRLIAFAPDACFHCMGVSSLGMDEASYTRLTLDVTKSLADHVYEANPRAVFTYVSGAGTDETERGGLMWARVKGAAENYVLQRGFRDAYAYRIGAVIPEKGVRSATGWVNLVYTLTRPFHGWMKRLDGMITSTQLGRSMIALVSTPYPEKRLENKDIKAIATGMPTSDGTQASSD